MDLYPHAGCSAKLLSYALKRDPVCLFEFLVLSWCLWVSGGKMLEACAPADKGKGLWRGLSLIFVQVY